MKNNLHKFIFFGTDQFSIRILEELKKVGLIPNLIVTAPDRPAGRGQKMTEPPVKTWAQKNEIEIKQPEKLTDSFISKISSTEWDFFVVASYGKIIPEMILKIPKHGCLNVHPSLLPLYRGASPIESTILDDQKETGVTIMLMDDKMDHGPILNQELINYDEWPTKIEVENQLAEIGGQLLVETIPLWISGEIKEQEQDHATATFTKKITKDVGQLEWSNIEKVTNGNYDEKIGREIFLKVQALNPWPGVYFFYKHKDRKIRIKIKSATYKNGKLKIMTVLPEGRKEMDFESFLRGY